MRRMTISFINWTLTVGVFSPSFGYLVSPLGFSLPSGYLYPKLHHFLDQTKGDRLIERELDRSPRALKTRQLLAEYFNGRWRGIEAYVLLKGCKMHEVPVQYKSRHPIFNRLLCVRSGLHDDGPDFMENLLNVWRETSDVFVDIFRC